jgi:hypothetical protein
MTMCVQRNGCFSHLAGWPSLGERNTSVAASYRDGHLPAIVAVLLNSLCGGPSARLSLHHSPLGGCGSSAMTDGHSQAAAMGEQAGSRSVCSARRACPLSCDAGGLAAPVLISRPSTALSED